MYHDPTLYHANRRVSCASGCVYGKLAPLPPLERHKAVPRHTRRKGNYVAGAKRGWEVRRARNGHAV